MFRSLHSLRDLRIANAALFRLVLAVVLVAGVAGCKTSAHSSDPHLRKIDEMLDAELPKGTTMTRVSVFLSSSGYRVEDLRQATHDCCHRSPHRYGNAAAGDGASDLSF